MKKVVRLVRSYDDVHLQDGTEVEADVEVRITIGEEELLALDLTDAHAATLRKDLAYWIKLAHPVKLPRSQGRRRLAGEPGIPVCKHPIPEGMSLEEGKQYLRGLRDWAAGEDRSDEIGGKGEKSYSYGQLLVDDYRAWLRTQTRPAPWEQSA